MQHRAIALAIAAAAFGANVAAAALVPAIHYTVKIVTSPRAASRLIATHAQVAVVPEYYGSAAPPHADEEDDMGLDLWDGRTRLLLPPQGGTVIVTGQGINAARLSWIKPGSVWAGAQVLSVRNGQPANILSCDPAITPAALRVVNGRTLTVRCKLSGE